MSVPWPASRTPRTGNPRAASASPSGRISSGVAVRSWTRSQRRDRVPGGENAELRGRADLRDGSGVAIEGTRLLDRESGLGRRRVETGLPGAREQLLATLLRRGLAALAADVREHPVPDLGERRRVRLDPLEGR